MITFGPDVIKAVKKGKLPNEKFDLFHNAFIALDKTKDMNLFDIKKFHSNEKDRTYYRLRKNKYRAIFYMDKLDYIILLIAKREEVYKLWQQ
jgi:mRNA interferase RelE/StbE